MKEKYERRIERLYQDIRNNKKVLLVWMSLISNIEKEVLIDCHRKIAEKFGKEIDFLIIEHDSQVADAEYTEIIDGIQYCRAAIATAQADGKKTYDYKKCLKIYKNYRHSYSWDYIWNIVFRKKIFKLPLRLFALLIPVTTWRKKFKRIYIK